MTSKRRTPKVPFKVLPNVRFGAHSSIAMRKKDTLPKNSDDDSQNNKKEVSITAITSDGLSPKKLIISNSSEFNSFDYDEDRNDLYLLGKESEQSFSYLSDISDQAESNLPIKDSSSLVCLSVPPYPQFSKDNWSNPELNEYYKNSVYVLNEDEESQEYAEQLSEFDINDLWFDSVATDIFETDYPEFLDNLQDEIDYNTYYSELGSTIAQRVTKDNETIEILKENPVNASFRAALNKQRDNALSDDEYDKEMSNLAKFNSQNYTAEELNQQWGFKNPQIGKYIAKYRKQLFVPS
ncbi:hypothetical protein M9Y10_001901 [Tritrichomonas musculus]|uniref:Uncharacterized protein n=1 Tax=Tritrichomonas musculus TaxID=1915356 RepID=A0ABR2LBB3_9EUKA